MSCSAILLKFALGLAAWHGDLADSPSARTALYTPVIESICRVATQPEHQAWLLAQVSHETNFARAVLEERCHLLGKLACDGGLAMGPWQVHRWCSDAWTASTLAARYDAGARCALRAARHGLSVCHSAEGAFAFQSGKQICRAPWARARLPLFWRALAALRGGK